ncbi:MAG: threonine synthase, partial [Alphaproteobacteria bacterium CG11_big_fil_rev_8_21_14_0_20_44_7]
MKYISTRGGHEVSSFREVVLAGLADDGGLFVPASYPKFSAEKIQSFANLSYSELAFEVISPFIDGDIPDEDLRKILSETYSENFRHPKIAPLLKIAEGEYLLELFHGPTLAFKDFALQLLGRLFDYFLRDSDKKISILGATSGDTGSAAIAGCAGREHVEIYILHPKGKVSEVQRRQMTTVLADNVHNIALDGNFDDCQNIVKEIFGDLEFKAQHNLSAVNSINWGRIVAQIVYYFYTAAQLGRLDKPTAFSVPTGNFGDILAGWIAHKMGLPIEKLVIATNKNDILHRFMQNGEYAKTKVEHSLSPSM